MLHICNTHSTTRFRLQTIHLEDPIIWLSREWQFSNYPPCARAFAALGLSVFAAALAHFTGPPTPPQPPPPLVRMSRTTVSAPVYRGHTCTYVLYIVYVLYTCASKSDGCLCNACASRSSSSSISGRFALANEDKIEIMCSQVRAAPRCMGRRRASCVVPCTQFSQCAYNPARQKTPL